MGGKLYTHRGGLTDGPCISDGRPGCASLPLRWLGESTSVRRRTVLAMCGRPPPRPLPSKTRRRRASTPNSPRIKKEEGQVAGSWRWATPGLAVFCPCVFPDSEPFLLSYMKWLSALDEVSANCNVAALLVAPLFSKCVPFFNRIET